MVDRNLLAHYENKRLIVLTAFLNHPERIEPALAFAYQYRIAPIHNMSMPQAADNIDVFDDIYDVNERLLVKIYSYLERRWHSADWHKFSFRDLESEFSKECSRHVLVLSLEYARLNGMFDDDFYAQLSSKSPIAGHNIRTVFRPEEVSLA